MAIQIQLRRDTAGNWLTEDPILAQGEFGFETDTLRFKIGNGFDNWSGLVYSSVILPITLADVSDAGTAASHAAGDFDASGAAAAVLATSVQKALNLSDLANIVTARTNLGLGTAATQAIAAFDAAGAAAAAQAASQPLDSDLTAIAALATTAYGRSLLALANAAAGRTAFGLGTSSVIDLDTDGTLAANSDAEIASQKATKTYSDTKIPKSLVTTKGDIIIASGVSTPARFPIGADGKVLAADSTKTLGVDWIASSGIILPNLNGGRATVTPGTPITTVDVLNAGSIYFTPYLHNYIALYTGSWATYQFAELTLVLAGLTATKLYDVFAYDVAGAVTLAIGPAWQNGSTRGAGAGTTEHAFQDNIRVNKYAISGGPGAGLGRYLFTFLATGAATTDDAAGGVTSQVGGSRCLFNIDNRVWRHLYIIDTTDNWSYTTDTIRNANGSGSNFVRYVAGVPEVFVSARLHATVYVGNNSARAAKVGIGVNVNNAFSSILVPGAYSTPGSIPVGNDFGYFALVSTYAGYTGLTGVNSIWWNEKGADGTCIFLGDNGGDSQQSGLEAIVCL